MSQPEELEEVLPDFSGLSISDLQVIVDRYRKIVDGNRHALRLAKSMMLDPENPVTQEELDILSRSTERTNRALFQADGEIKRRIYSIFKT